LKVIAVLDWELSTIGDPLCDIANMSMMYFMPSMESRLGVAGLKGLNLHSTGIPSEKQLLQSYCKWNPHISYDIAQSWSGFYLAFLCFKNAVIVHGVKQRLASGVASSKNAKSIVLLLPMLVQEAQSMLEKRPPPSSIKSRL